MPFRFAAGSWPVMQRELRESSRRPMNHILRAAAVTSGTVVLWLAFQEISAQYFPPQDSGKVLFGILNLFLVGLCYAVVPIMTADCLSSERREGTLGLLFMTPLSASGVVIGKIAARVLRVLTLWLAAAPMLTIPFLYGGLSWSEIIESFLVQLITGMLCLVAGILATSFMESRASAYATAIVLTAIFGSLSISYRNRIFSSPVTAIHATSLLIHELLLIGVILAFAIHLAGWRLKRSARDRIPSAQGEELTKRYCTPISAKWFAVRMGRKLDKNPIAWLQQYSWKARIMKWGLCLLFILVECRVLSGNNPQDLGSSLGAMLVILMAGYVFAGVNGFVRERKSGALELLLVTPLSVNQIIFGRVWGLWKQFFPSLLILLGSDLFFHLWVMPDDKTGHLFTDIEVWRWAMYGEIVAIYLAFPFIATSCALCLKNQYAAAVLAILVVFAPAIYNLRPVIASLEDLIVPDTQYLFTDASRVSMPICIAIWALHAICACLAYSFLDRTLRRRSFAY